MDGWIVPTQGNSVTTSNKALIIAELYEEYETALTRYAQRLTHESSWAEDLVQDTFVRAMGHLDLLEILKQHQRRAWLYRTLKNRFLDVQASRRRHEALARQLEEPALQAWNAAPLEYMPNPFDLAPEQYREILHMRYSLEMNSTEIAEALGIPPATVRSRLHLAMKQMRRNKFLLE